MQQKLCYDEEQLPDRMVNPCEYQPLPENRTKMKKMVQKLIIHQLLVHTPMTMVLYIDNSAMHCVTIIMVLYIDTSLKLKTAVLALLYNLCINM